MSNNQCWVLSQFERSAAILAALCRLEAGTTRKEKEDSTQRRPNFLLLSRSPDHRITRSSPPVDH